MISHSCYQYHFPLNPAVTAAESGSEQQDRVAQVRWDDPNNIQEHLDIQGDGHGFQDTQNKLTTCHEVLFRVAKCTECTELLLIG